MKKFVGFLTGVLTFAIGFLLLGSWIAPTQLSAWAQAGSDLIHEAAVPFDSRPTETILFVGNSRIYVNNLPAMVRRVADSAGSRVRYDTTMYAQANRALKDHWNDPTLRKMLGQKWDYVVLQGGSSEQLTPFMQSEFATYGGRLVDLVQRDGAKPVLLVAWRPEPDYYPTVIRNVPPRSVYAWIQDSYASLAETTGAATANAGWAFEAAADRTGQSLTMDGNHPNMRGTYIAALMVYRALSNDDLSRVTYVPPGVAPDDAAILRSVAMGR